jgi:AcrR family transcriptional regulator
MKRKSRRSNAAASHPPKARVSTSATGRGKPSREILTSVLLDKAAGLFEARGFASTSLQDIADAVGLSRPSMYHYFRSKEALLQQLVQGVTLPITTIFDHLDDAADQSPLDKIRDVAQRLVMWVIDPTMHFRLIERTENELPAHIASPHRVAKRRVFDGMVKLIEAAIGSGEVRAVDPRIASFAILGMCNWTASWYSSKGPLSAKQIAAEIAELAVASVRRADRNGSDVHSITGDIRAQLDLIDRLSPTIPNIARR